VTLEPTPAKGIEVSSAVITRMEGEGDTKGECHNLIFEQIIKIEYS
jgi:hypothetical protein